MMKILLIGGAGYIGSNVSKLLKEKRKDDYVLILDNFSTGRVEALVPGVDWVNADVRNLAQLESIFKNYKFDLVMDFSAMTVVSESVQKPLDYYEDNFIGTYNIISCMKKYGVKNIIFSSTAAVYGNTNNSEPIIEETLKRPINPYGNSKLCSEYLIQDSAKAYGLNYVIFRYFNVAGASDDYKYGFFRKNPTLLIPALNQSILEKEKFHIFGDSFSTKDGTCVRDYIHVVDLANAHILAIDYLKNNNQNNIFNLGSGNGFSVKEVLLDAQKVLGVNINYDVLSPRPGDPAILITNNEKATKLLKWTVTKKLEDMIQSDYIFRKNNQEIISKKDEKNV